MLYSINNGIDSETCVALLHGFGADEKDLFDLQVLFPGAHVVSYQGPLDLTPYGYFGGRAWFPLDFTPYGIEYDIDEMLKVVDSVTEELITLKKKFKKLFLCGFSQGAIISHAVFLNGKAPIDGLAGLSGRFSDSVFKESLLPNIEGKPVFLSHGTVDEVIPVSSGREIFSFYKKSDADLTANIYQMGHNIDFDCQRDLKEWFEKVMDL